MSAYGTLANPTAELPQLASTIWATRVGSQRSEAGTGINSGGPQSTTEPAYITIHHLNLARAEPLTGLIENLHEVFAAYVEEGATYPQETPHGEAYTLDAFRAYFFAGDVFVAVEGGVGKEVDALGEGMSVKETTLGIADARNGRAWKECIAGFYYVKPNYPGRSSHICNAGFVVPPSRSGRGYGSLLARSYLHYAPALGYQASVFNLVYVNNIASVKMWEKLDFTKAGRIPRAGRLKRRDGTGEEYVDAWVFYKSFV